MKVITLAHQKGGVGKSTIALNLAYSLSDHLDVGVMDIDPQGSIKTLEPEGINLVDQIKNDQNDLLIIDTPPYLSNSLVDIFKISDLIIIPTKPGVFDLLAIYSTIELVKQVNKQDNCRVLFNMVKHNSNVKDKVLYKFKEMGVGLFENHLTERVNYIKSVTESGIINSNDRNGAREFRHLINEIVKILWGSNKA